MMKIHKEGYNLILLFSILIIVIEVVITLIFPVITILHLFLYMLGAFLLLLIVRFFRSPERNIEISDNRIYAPADGRIVVVEKVIENEYFRDERIQVSIFMSAYNVHVNWFPVSGFVKYFRYHKGSYIIARHPKSSEKNERTSLVIKNPDNIQILIRQIAGIVARRIVSYSNEGDHVTQGDQMGFIKFGSRVDLFLPTDVKLKVKLKQKVVGAATIIAEFK